VSTATKARTSSQSSSGELTEQRLGDLAFTYLLDQHPRRLTLDQLGCEIVGDREALERAIANLDEACLLSRQGGELVPSPAAIRINLA
jgi:hypothetical protein